MKKTLYSILAAAAVFAACNEEMITDGTGSLSFKIDEVSENYVTKADEINTDDFYVTVSDWNGNAVTDGTVTYENIQYKDLPNEITGLPSGPYLLPSLLRSYPAVIFQTSFFFPPI